MIHQSDVDDIEGEAVMIVSDDDEEFYEHQRVDCFSGDQTEAYESRESHLEKPLRVDQQYH